MIVVDNRAGSAEFAPLLERLGIPVYLDLITSGDFAFTGWTDHGHDSIGVERKTIPDLMTCMTDGRYVTHQLVNMLNDYREVWLLVEGIWWEAIDGTVAYKMHYQQRNTRIMFTALHKFLLSITRVAGVRIEYSKGRDETARKVADLYTHAQKPMDQHSTFKGFRTDSTVVSTLSNKTPLVQRWAKELPGIGWNKAAEFGHQFPSGYELATASARKMATVKGVSEKMAAKFYREIRGIK